MIFFLIFFASVIYEDIRNIFDFKRYGECVEHWKFERKGWKLDMSFNGRLSEFIYVFGLFIGMATNEAVLYILLYLLALVPKSRLWWIVIDTTLSILIVSVIFMLKYYLTMADTYDLIRYFAK